MDVSGMAVRYTAQSPPGMQIFGVQSWRSIRRATALSPKCCAGGSGQYCGFGNINCVRGIKLWRKLSPGLRQLWARNRHRGLEISERTSHAHATWSVRLTPEVGESEFGRTQADGTSGNIAVQGIGMGMRSRLNGLIAMRSRGVFPLACTHIATAG